MKNYKINENIMSVISSEIERNSTGANIHEKRSQLGRLRNHAQRFAYYKNKGSSFPELGDIMSDLMGELTGLGFSHFADQIITKQN